MLSRFKRKGTEIKRTDNKMQKGVKLLKTPITSRSDKKDYRLIELSNGLKALLIHHEFECKEVIHSDDESSEDENELDTEDDEEEEEVEREKPAAVAMCIGAGSFEDQHYGIEGLAHFVGKQLKVIKNVSRTIINF